MEHALRRSVTLDAIDEKIELLAKKNVFLVAGEIDFNTVGGLFANMFTKLSGANKKLWVILDSPGGDINQGLAVFDFLRALSFQGYEVGIIAIGEIASMAVCILQAGTKRYAFPNVQFTVHQASLYGDGSPQEVNKLVENAKELERLNGIVLGIISQRAGMGIEQLLHISKKTDHSMDANNAIKFGSQGLIDEIITTFPFQINGD